MRINNPLLVIMFLLIIFISWHVYMFSGYNYYESDNYYFNQIDNLDKKMNVVLDGDIENIRERYYKEKQPYLLRIGIYPANNINSINKLLFYDSNNRLLQSINTPINFTDENILNTSVRNIVIAANANKLTVVISTNNVEETISAAMTKNKSIRKSSRLREFWQH